jgi:hypothetical protein
MLGRLNSFQKSMLEWNDLHPYNAVHVVRIGGVLDSARLERAAAATLERLGLTGLTLDRGKGSYEYAGGPAAIEVKEIKGDSTAAASIAAEIERQVNTPFPQGDTFNPFRFFVQREPESFWLGLVYFHAVADGESVIHLLKEIVGAYRGRDAQLGHALERHLSRRGSLLRHHPAALARKILSLPSEFQGMRRSCRFRRQDTDDLSNKFVWFVIESGSLASLAQTAKAWGVTLNDLFLAIFMKAAAPWVPGRMKASRRRSISLGCIVNIRKDLRLSGEPAFGLCLGSFVVHHEVPEGITLEQLARDLARQTARIKRRRLYLGTGLELALGRFMVSLYSPARRRKLYQKHYPLWGGITNLDLNARWEPSGESGVLDYLRGVSTGPITPLVLAITTCGQAANVGVSYRSSLFKPADIEALRSCFVDPFRPQTGNP